MMRRRHIPIQEVAAGSRIFVVPRDDSTPRGPGLGPIPTEGMVVVADDYIVGCIARGALVAYEAEEHVDSGGRDGPEADEESARAELGEDPAETEEVE